MLFLYRRTFRTCFFMNLYKNSKITRRVIIVYEHDKSTIRGSNINNGWSLIDSY